MDVRKIGEDAVCRESNLGIRLVEFKDGAVGTIVTGDDQLGWSLCSAKDEPDLYLGVGIAVLRMQKTDDMFEKMFRNIPEPYYKRMILEMWEVELV